MGLVGTYDEGLQHIQDQLTQHSSASQAQPRRGVRKPNTHAAAAAAAAASPAGPEESDPEDTPTDSPGLGSPASGEVLFRCGSLGVSSTSSGGRPEGSTDAAVAITPAAADTDAADACASSKAGLWRQQGGGVDVNMWSRSKVVMWLGSSIGNCDRHQAAQFLRQVKDKALNPGAQVQAAPKALPVAPALPCSTVLTLTLLLCRSGQPLCPITRSPSTLNRNLFT
jgi:hypothetical protein